MERNGEFPELLASLEASRVLDHGIDTRELAAKRFNPPLLGAQPLDVALFRRGQEVGLLVQDVFPINDRSSLAGFKTHNYLESMLAATAAVEAGCYDALRLNTRGFLAEGAVSNLFFSSEGRLMTPSEHTGLLPGVVRAAILEALPVVEGLFTLDQLLRAEAVFLTNSSIGVLPVDFLLHEGSRIDLQSIQHPDAAEIVEACISKRARTCVHP